MSDHSVNESSLSSPVIQVEHITEFHGPDLDDLCDATEATMHDSEGFSIGFNRDGFPTREQLENYWKGILLIPDRKLVVGRLDGTIASSIQMIKPSIYNYATSFSATLESHFVAPWARGHGLAKMLVKKAETIALEYDISVIKLSVRANQKAAISLYETLGFHHWGTLEKYEQVEGKMFAGRFYYKDILKEY